MFYLLRDLLSRRQWLRGFAFRSSVAFLAATTLPSCNALKSEANEPEKIPLSAEVVEKPRAVEISDPNESFYFCPIKPQLLENEPTGGLAALATVLVYWDLQSNESMLAEKYPLGEGTDYEMLKLRRIAIDEGLMAFSLTMKQKPIEQVSEQLEHGRPVIVPLENDAQTFFGAPVEDFKEFASIRRSSEPDTAGSPYRFVVIFGQNKDQFLLLDPTFGVVSVDKKTFSEEWGKKKYSALLCSSF